MKFTRIFALIIAAALGFTACSGETDEATITVNANSNPLLAHVPVDTAYVFADLESVPEDITDAYVNRFQPVLDEMSKHIAKFKADYAAGEFQDDVMATLASAVLDELGGDLSAESLEKLGISLQAHHAIYAMGVFPVIRIELTDAQALRDAITRIETKMGYEIPESELNGTSYWRIEEDVNAGVYMAILDQQFVISAFPANAADNYLPALLGHDLPVTSMAGSNTLANLNRDKGYSAYGSGILDLQKLADEVLNPQSETRMVLDPIMTTSLQSLDAVCIAEIKSMVARAPRMTAGTTVLTANKVAMRYDLEMESALAMGLAALVSDTPAAVEGDYLLSASLALQVGKLRNFVLEKVNAIVASPYQCAHLQELNQNAMELVGQLNIPMPPMVNNLMGVRVRMNDFDIEQSPPSGDGLLSVHVDKPEMFVGMASMMVPGFDSLDLANQSEPVRIPAEMMPLDGMDIFALMGDSAIGVAVGEQHAGELKGFLSMKGKNNGTFFSVSHDMARQMQLQDAMSDRIDIDIDNHDSAVHDYSEAFKQHYIDMLGRSRVDMRFTSDGLVVDSEMTFK